jgi:hypothetical protein
MSNSEPGQEWISMTRKGISEPKNLDEIVIETQGMFHTGEFFE